MWRESNVQIKELGCDHVYWEKSGPRKNVYVWNPTHKERDVNVGNELIQLHVWNPSHKERHVGNEWIQLHVPLA